MANKSNRLAAEVIDFPSENSVHIAGVTGSSPVSPTIQAPENKKTKARTVQCPLDQSYLVGRLRDVFGYDPEVGGLFFRKTRAPAGYLRPNGYRQVRFEGAEWKEHRLVWIWIYGRVPGELDEIDHIDGNRANNRIENLRLVSRQQNQWNAKKRKDNTSGFKGVSWNKKSKRWSANISIDGRVVYLGMFDTPEEAHAAYSAYAKRIRGEFARLN